MSQPSPKRGLGLLAIPAVVLALFALVLWVWLGGERRIQRITEEKEKAFKEPAVFVGGQACTECHQQEHDLWLGSDHDLAMQEATAETVVGDFNNTSFTYGDVTSTFYTRDGRYFVNTDGPDGELREFEIAYTFGIRPLQQYLIPFPRGYYQALNVCWDTRPKEEGGQRWFHLYPNDIVTHEDPLHWTGLYQNWNYMCSECHSTGLERNYSYEEDRYSTSWSEVNVSCEACHGPGSRHVAYARAAEEGQVPRSDARKGLELRLKDDDNAVWLMDMETGIAKRSVPRTSQTLIELCARCHSRRAPINNEYVFGRPLLDTHHLTLLDEEMYFADGQIQDEVYVYGSFIQSKMYHQGVTCRDCHDSHSMHRYSDGNALCSLCHLTTKYDTEKHHFHKPGTAGAACIDCHMPARTYMVVDPRNDHSFRIPRPDLSGRLGTPNACNLEGCHADKSDTWSVEKMVEWYGTAWNEKPHYGETLHAGRTSAAEADIALIRLADDTAQPDIVRATALTMIMDRSSPEVLQLFHRATISDGPLLRTAAVESLAGVDAQNRLVLAAPLLSDPVRAVRLESALVLADIPRETVPEQHRYALEQATAEYFASQRGNADRPEAHANLGSINTFLGRYEEAEAVFLAALSRWPTAVPLATNLADLYRVLGRDDEGERVLRRALAESTDAATLHHALGLLLVRLKQYGEAVRAFERAAELEPGNAHFSYVHGVALNSVGEAARAVTVLEEAHQRHPNDRELLLALITIERDRGRFQSAVAYAEKLVALSPRDQAALQLLQQLEFRAGW